MIINLNTTMILTCKITAINLMITSLEYLNINEVTNETGIWRWNEQKFELNFMPKIIQNFYQFIFSDKIFFILLVSRFLISFNLIFSQNFWNIGFLFLTTILISQRFRGAYNGGSDYMTILTTAALTVGLMDKNNPQVLKSIFVYLALQVTLSYFFAGIVKIRNKEWRSGLALSNLTKGPNYSPPLLAKKLFKSQRVSLITGWIIIITEILFPLIYLSKSPEIFLVLAFLFHLINFFFFGLNRFVWAWMATYPALIFVIKLI